MDQHIWTGAQALIDRMESAGALGNKDRLPALLRYLVSEELAGRGERLKAHDIATTVLGRNADFDPQQDSIVRVEIARLRRTLDLYFATAGASEPLKISIPRGSYRPTFSTAATNSSVPARLGWHRRLLPLAGLAMLLVIAVSAVFFPARMTTPAPQVYASATPRLAIAPVTTDAGDADARIVALGLRAELATELSRQSWLSVSMQDAPLVAPPAATKLFSLGATLGRDTQGYVLSAQLHAEPDHKVVWAGTYRNAMLHKPLYGLAQDLSAQMARDLGYPLGPVGQAVAARSASTDPDVEDRFLCMMNAFRYWRGLEPKQRNDAQACLQRLTVLYPDFTEGRSALALMALEDARYESQPVRRSQYIARAETLLRGAVPDRITLVAQMTLAACKGETDATKAFARQLQAIAPNDPDTLAEIADKAGLAALDWDFALKAETRAFQLAVSPTPRYAHAAAAKAVMEGDYEAALRAMSRVPQTGLPLGQTMLLAIATLANAPLRAESAAAALGHQTAQDPAQLLATVEKSCWHNDVKAAFATAIARMDAPVSTIPQPPAR